MTRLVDADSLIAAIQREIDDTTDSIRLHPHDRDIEKWKAALAELEWARKLVDRRALEQAA